MVNVGKYTVNTWMPIYGMAARDGTRTPRWHLRWTRGSWYAPKESQAAMALVGFLGPGPTGGGAPATGGGVYWLI